MNQILLSKNEFKALSSETRTEILKILDERNYTLSELSKKTNMSAPTIKQHAKILVDSGLIELKDEGRKWKYYELTKKGKEILSTGTNPTNVLLILSTTIIGIAAIAVILSGLFLQNSAMLGNSAAPIADTEKSFAVDETLQKAAITATKGCTPLFTVEASKDTGISASEYYAANCFESETKENCEQQDFYNATTASFGEKDGIIDCKWQ
ncbi:MAG: hypothetical protein COV47_02185 [Candidatus Diapherotrites archaeon CG11_big_fil_rev_8_21_14_0_20_37_9]|nr:MAG: hypothetical protein COV47_02185 [Candidatus Diapherotrites archaeon CG11_big_fil_rev_8_21_14_0_20_37_9]